MIRKSKAYWRFWRGPSVVSDGYWLLVTPLTPGSHTIRFKGVNNAGFATEVTYNLTVGQ